jgi:hypothetical protein
MNETVTFCPVTFYPTFKIPWGFNLPYRGHSVFNKGVQYTMDDNWPWGQFTMGFKIPYDTGYIKKSVLSHNNTCYKADYGLTWQNVWQKRCLDTNIVWSVWENYGFDFLSCDFLSYIQNTMGVQFTIQRAFSFQ